MRPISSAMSLNTESLRSNGAMVSFPLSRALPVLPRMRHAAKRGLSDFPPDHVIERPFASATDEEMKYDDRPEQRVLDTARFPAVSELVVIGRDRRDEKDEDRSGRHAREQAQRQANPTDEFQHPNHPGPQQSILKIEALEKTRRAFDVAEEDLRAVERERPA